MACWHLRKTVGKGTDFASKSLENLKLCLACLLVRILLARIFRAMLASVAHEICFSSAESKMMSPSEVRSQ